MVQESLPLLDTRGERARDEYPSQGQRSNRYALFIALFLLIAAGVVIAVLFTVALKDDKKSKGSEALASAMTARNIMSHLYELEEISKNFTSESNTVGCRSSITGYNASAEYILARLAETDFNVTTVPFQIASFSNIGPNSLTLLEGTGTVEKRYQETTDFLIMQYSGAGNVTAELDYMTSVGCVESDWDGLSGKIVIVPRGNCSFYEKAVQGYAAGAVGIIFANIDDGPLNSRANGEGPYDMIPLPMMTVTNSFSLDLMTDVDLVRAANGTLAANMQVITSIDYTNTYNIICDTPYGRDDQVIVVGSHLDSVEAGPGINDNGSGSAVNLELALQLFRLRLAIENKIRFAWWGAEELGLLGSKAYVRLLNETQPEELGKIALNLNFDMLGSPNPYRGVYDGSSANSGDNNYGEKVANGSTVIQNLFESRFTQKGLNFSLSPFDGRSDYGPFIEKQIPAGGLFTGAEKIKDADERELYGGLANAAYDPCYHAYCDTAANIDQTTLQDMADVAAWVLQRLATEENLPALLNDNGTISLSHGEF
eukprot:m.100624 g.100624  ORF g.100624 m.100624 type:complete len:541 (-) comp22241_c0_seq2:47-1669(-)